MPVTSRFSAQANSSALRAGAPKRRADIMPASPDSSALWAVSPLIALILAVSAAAWSLPAQAADPQPTFTERVRENVREGAQAVGDYSSDALITTKVKAAMVANGEVKALDVNVSTKNGVVRLEGAVDTPEQRATAERLARDVADVRSVDNQLDIKRR